MTVVATSGGGGITAALPSGWSKYGGPSGSALNAAPAASWNALISALASGPLRGKRVILNVAGEVLPLYGSPNAQTGWTPADVARFCRGGGVWIDYCGWPMFYAANTAQTGNPGSGGFQKFLTAAGAYGLPYSNFETGTLPSGAYPYLRSLVLNVAPPQVSWFDPNLNAPTRRPYKTGTTFGNYWIYASFGLFLGQGAYFYAYGGYHYNANFSYQAGLPASTYATFVNNAASQIGNGVVPVTTAGGSVPGTPSGSSATSPTGLRQTAATTSTITFAWNAVSGGSSYQIGHVVGSAITVRATLTGRTIKFTGLTSGQSESVAVRAKVGGVWSAWSAPLVGHTASAGTTGTVTTGSSGTSTSSGTSGTPTVPGQSVIPTVSTSGLASLSTTEKVALGAAGVAAIVGAIALLRD